MKESAVIKRVGKEWCVFSEGGKRLGCYNSRKGAEKRLKQIEYWKHKKGSSEESQRNLCYCRECGAEFYSSHVCHSSSCPLCGEQDNIIEL